MSTLKQNNKEQTERLSDVHHQLSEINHRLKGLAQLLSNFNPESVIDECWLAGVGDIIDDLTQKFSANLDALDVLSLENE